MVSPQALMQALQRATPKGDSAQKYGDQIRALQAANSDRTMAGRPDVPSATPDYLKQYQDTRKKLDAEGAANSPKQAQNPMMMMLQQLMSAMMGGGNGGGLGGNGNPRPGSPIATTGDGPGSLVNPSLPGDFAANGNHHGSTVGMDPRYDPNTMPWYYSGSQ